MALLTSLNRGGTTAGVVDVVSTYEHGITTGQVVRVFDTPNDTFHGYYPATNATSTTFTLDTRNVITAISRSASVVSASFTPTASLAYGQIAVGASVTVAGVTTAGFDGTFVVTALPARNVIQYAQSASNATGTVAATSYIFPSSASTTGGYAMPVIQLVPAVLDSNDGMVNIGGAADEVAAVTDNLDTTFLRASDVFTRSVSYNLSNVPTSGAGAVQANQEAYAVLPRLRYAATAASDLEVLFSTDTQGLYYLSGTSIVLSRAPGNLNDIQSVWDGSLYAESAYPWTTARLNLGNLSIRDYAPTLAARAYLYELETDVYLWTKPYLSLLAVSTSGLRGTLSWTHRQADEQGQTWYEIAVYTAATTSPGASNTTNRVWYSGEVYSSATTREISTDLATGVTYFAYVRTGVQRGAIYGIVWGQWGSAFPSSDITFTIPAERPVSPLMSATWNSATAATDLTVRGYGNLLSADDASFETTVGNWVANANCSVTRSSTVGGAFFGSWALRLSSTAAGDMSTRSANLAAGGFVANPGTSYKAYGVSRAGGVARLCRLEFYWYNSSGTFLSSTIGGTTTNASTVWVAMTVESTAPSSSVTASANAAYGVVYHAIIGTAGASELHYLDTVAVTPNNDGQATLINLHQNPSAETVTTGVTSAQSAVTVSSDAAYVGERSFKVTTSTTFDRNLFATASSQYGIPSTGTYNVSAFLYVPPGSALAGAVVEVGGEGGASANYTNGTNSPATLVAGRWIRATRNITWTSTSGLPSLVARATTNPIALGADVYCDGWMVVSGSAAVSYFDGSVGNARWRGSSTTSQTNRSQAYDEGGRLTRTITVQRSTDFGQTWINVRALTAAAQSMPVQLNTGSDYEAPRGMTVLYRAKVDANDGTQVLSSIYSPPIEVSTTTANNWILKDPLNPSANIVGLRVQAQSVSNVQDEQTGVFRVFGRTKSLVTAGALTGYDGTLEVFCTNAQYDALQALLGVQRTLLLQEPNGDQKYVRVTQRDWTTEWLSGAQHYRVNIGYVEVEAP